MVAVTVPFVPRFLGAAVAVSQQLVAEQRRLPPPVAQVLPLLRQLAVSAGVLLVVVVVVGPLVRLVAVAVDAVALAAVAVVAEVVPVVTEVATTIYKYR